MCVSGARGHSTRTEIERMKTPDDSVAAPSSTAVKTAATAVWCAMAVVADSPEQTERLVNHKSTFAPRF